MLHRASDFADRTATNQYYTVLDLRHQFSKTRGGTYHDDGQQTVELEDKGDVGQVEVAHKTTRAPWICC